MSTQHAIAMLQRGDVAGAAALLERVVAAAPADAPALAVLGHCLMRLRRDDEAWRCLTLACHLSDRLAPAFSDLAWLAIQRGDAATARSASDRAIALNPSDANAHFVRAQLLWNDGRIDAGEQAFETAHRLNGRLADARFELGNRLYERGDIAGAQRHYFAFTQKRANDAQGWINLGLSSARIGDVHRARTALERAVQLAPESAKPAVLLAMVVRESGVADAEQIPLLSRAVELAPDDATLRFQLVCALFSEQDFAAARRHLREVIARDPQNLTARWLDFQLPQRVVSSQTERDEFLARWRDGIAAFETIDWSDAAIASRASDVVTSTTAFYLSYQREPLVAEHARNAAVLRCMAAAAGWTRDEVPLRMIERPRRRIAVIASTLVAKSISLIWSSAFLRLDAEKFELGVFCMEPADDAVARAWKTRATVFETGPRQIEQWIAALRAFDPDLALFSGIGTHRFVQALASVRQAPVQAAIWSHPCTTGMRTIDYFLSADACEPVDAQAHYTESLIRLPRLGAYLDPPETPPAHAPRDDADVRMLCTQSADKLHPAHDDLFARILVGASAARLDILCSKPQFVADELAARMRTAFQVRGVDFDARCRVLGGQPLDVYRGFLARADLCLDSLDFSGGLTSLDALWHEVPIVTLPGALMRGRQTYGMLKLLDLNELIARDAEDYVRIAVELSENAARRDALRERIAAGKSALYRDAGVVAALADFLGGVQPRNTA